MLLAALVLVHAAGQGWRYYQLRSADQRLDSALKEFVATALPGDSGTGNVRHRVEQQLLAAQNGGGSTLLLAALSHLGAPLRQATGAQLQALSFHDGLLDMKLRAPDADTLDKLNQSLNAGGWHAELTSGTVQSGGYEGRIELQGQSSGQGSGKGSGKGAAKKPAVST
jgi:type II secretion system protein L